MVRPIFQTNFDTSVIRETYPPPRYSSLWLLKGGLCLTGFILLLFSVFSIPISAASQSDKQKLVQLKKQIKQLQLELEADNKQKDHAVYLLQKAEKEVANASRKLSLIENDSRMSRQQLARLQQEQNGLREQLATNQEYLINQIRAAYSIGKQEYVKLLLNQEDPATVSRMMVYYQYFNQARSAQLQKIDKRLLRLKTVSDDIKTQSEKLTHLRQQTLEERQLLNVSREERSKVVASLSASLREKNQRLNSLMRDEQHLQRLLQEIESQLSDVNLDLSPPEKFNRLKGKLRWPATGRISARFGSLRNNSGNLKWKGVVIKTEAGNSVKSVAYGRIVFADWLRGFGMLIIIDHGDDYMSLYGHNERLHKKLGDWVQANEIIATSGDSGGHTSASVYFEIRHKGKPQDPVKWLDSTTGKS